MCYHISYLTKRAEKLAKRYGRDEAQVTFFQAQIQNLPIGPVYHAAGFNHPQVPVLTEYNKGIQLFSWGLIPHWVKSKTDADSIRNNTLNARVETMFEKPAFREAAQTRRCIVLIDGFFEFHHHSKKNFPYFIRLRSDEPMSLAGLWDEWIDTTTGHSHETFTIITTQANGLMNKIHNQPKASKESRMPLILSKENEEAWLNSINENSDQNFVNNLARPFLDAEMESYTVRRLTGAAALGNVPACIEPFRYAELDVEQTTLF